MGGQAGRQAGLLCACMPLAAPACIGLGRAHIDCLPSGWKAGSDGRTRRSCSQALYRPALFGREIAALGAPQGPCARARAAGGHTPPRPVTAWCVCIGQGPRLRHACELTDGDGLRIARAPHLCCAGFWGAALPGQAPLPPSHRALHRTAGRPSQPPPSVPSCRCRCCCMSRIGPLGGRRLACRWSSRGPLGPWPSRRCAGPPWALCHAMPCARVYLDKSTAAAAAASKKRLPACLPACLW